MIDKIIELTSQPDFIVFISVLLSTLIGSFASELLMYTNSRKRKKDKYIANFFLTWIFSFYISLTILFFIKTTNILCIISISGIISLQGYLKLKDFSAKILDVIINLLKKEK